MAGRTGQGGADAPVYFKPLELCLIPLTHLGSEPGDAAAPPLRVRALVIPRIGRKVVLNRAERERAFRRILTERGARPPGRAVVGAGGALPLSAPLDLNSKRGDLSALGAGVCCQNTRGLSFGPPGAVKGETL